MRRLLIVDDDERQREDIAFFARKLAGFDTDNIDLVDDFQQAWNIVLDREYDLAVVDMMLSDPPIKWEGLAIIKRLKEYQPACWIIALTTKVGLEAGKRALDAGADDFISVGWSHDVRQTWGEFLGERLKRGKKAVESAHRAEPATH